MFGIEKKCELFITGYHLEGNKLELIYLLELVEYTKMIELL